MISLRIAVGTISDTRTEKNDTSGQTLVDLLTEAGHTLVEKKIITDDQPAIIKQVLKWADDPEVDVVLTTGGTGVTRRDVTPEAVESIFEKRIDGFGELFRYISYKKIGASTIQSRATAGVCRGTLVFSMPGSTGACRDAWNEVLVSQLDSRTKPCNFATLLPRIRKRPAS